MGATVLATVFTLENRCSFTVWPGTLSANGAAILAEGGFELPPGYSIQFPAPAGSGLAPVVGSMIHERGIASPATVEPE